MFKSRLVYIFFFFLLLLIINHYSLFKNTINILNFTYKERLIKSYGFCSETGFGYIEYLKKNYKNIRNINIINYSSIEPTQWIIYEPSISKNGIDKKIPEAVILINYPGKYIKNFANYKNGSFVVDKNIRYTNAISEIDFSLDNQNLKSIIIEIEIKNKFTDRISNYKLFNINNIEKDKIKKRIYYEFDSLIHDNIYINFKDKNGNLINNKIKYLLITFQNKILLENYKIINNYNNCFYLTK